MRWMLVIALLFPCMRGVYAQVVVYEDFVPPRTFIYMRERFVYAQIHTAGFTIGYEQGRLSRKFVYSGWNVEFATQINPKTKAVNWYGQGRSYKYGMLNSFCMLRVGYGGLIVLNDKPHWGGVQVSLSYRGGFSLGLAFPQYVYVLYDTAGRDIRLEKMNPDNPRHLDVGYILKRGPVLKGFAGLRPYPGVYAKLGMDFEFGEAEKRSHTLGFGVLYDCYFTRIPLMAFKKNPPGFLNFYLEYKFGMRYGVR
ncbi:MAG: hypothetical protein K2L50_00855 [Bacteroidales bacterium]|nr:hypothetical protein [Bacteroidales bacterium]